jgi:hypothetical protein
VGLCTAFAIHHHLKIWLYVHTKIHSRRSPANRGVAYAVPKKDPSADMSARVADTYIAMIATIMMPVNTGASVA